MVQTPPFQARKALRPFLLGCSAVWLISAPALWAQDLATQNVPLSFGVSQTFETVNNQNFDNPSAGTTGMSITALSFGSARNTPSESLNFDGGLGIGVTRNTDGSYSTALNSPHLALTYDSTAASSALKVYASYSDDLLQQISSFTDFINSQGQIVLPSNPADLVSTGLKQDIIAGGSLEIGRDAPFGLTVTASGENISYTQTTDPTLQNLNRAWAGLTGRFSYSPLGDVTLGVSTEHQLTFETPENIQRNTQDLSLGTNYDVSPVLSLFGSVKYEIVDETNAAQTRTPRAQVGANYTLPNGSLSFQIGDQDSSLNWQETLPWGGVSVHLSHGLDTSGNGSLNQAGFSYNQTINDVSGLNMGLFYSSDTAGSSTSTDLTAASLTVSYTHQLTQDWGLNLGANVRLRDPSNNDPSNNSTSGGLFVTVSRTVNFLH